MYPFASRSYSLEEQLRDRPDSCVTQLFWVKKQNFGHEQFRHATASSVKDLLAAGRNYSGPNLLFKQLI
ncbi:hypothetical protein JCGZ_12660 [Jatropha curcas]|uniref:Uncharacterized protein n=1 Tax=Jatropha curcas TaxID=180498 RepID=A0A067KDY6_JATCU|nr:hypothetical protein JCGZ_12660 [Jatropha curcas]